MLGLIDPTLPIVITATAGAMSVVVKLVLDALKEQRRGFEKFMGNHMSTNVRVLEHLTKATADVAVNLATLNVKTETLHEDNKEVARVLRESDQRTAATLKTADRTVTRKVKDQSQP